MFQMSKRQWIVLCSALFCAFAAGGFLVWQKFQASDLTQAGDSPNNPMILSASGFIYGNQYCGTNILTSSTDPAGKSQVNYMKGAKPQDFSDRCVNSNSDTTSTAYKDLTGKYVQIGDGTNPVTIVTWGGVSVAGMIISNGATVTHAPLVGNVFSGATVYPSVPGYLEMFELDYNYDGSLTTFGAMKKVDITANDFKIKDGGKINVSGMGYDIGYGGVGCTSAQNTTVFGDITPVGCSLQDGAPGINKNVNSAGMATYGFGGGGNSSVAAGGQALSYSYTNNLYNLSTVPTLNPSLPYGGGGGFAYTQTDASTMSNFTIQKADLVNRYSAGGGYVKIQAGTIEISRKAEIHANGNAGYAGPSGNIMPTGGGAGGTININATSTIFSWPTTTTDPVVAAGTAGKIMFQNIQVAGANISGNAYSGAAGRLTSSPTTTTHFGNLITASGGNDASSTCTHCGTGGSGGASGAGGAITISAPTYSPLCEISAATYAGTTTVPGVRAIPDACGANSDVVLDATGYIDPTPATPVTTWVAPDGGSCVLNTGQNANYDSSGYPQLDAAGEPCISQTSDPVDGDHTDDTFTITLAPGVHSYKSLTMNGPVTLNGPALAEGDTNAISKLVDLNIASTLSMTNGAKIDVSGLGYRGAYVTGSDSRCNNSPGTINGNGTAKSGWGTGTGGGISYIDDGAAHAAGGGGFGSDGGRSAADTGSGTKYGLGPSSGWEYGSGGGAEQAKSGSDVQAYDGGNGGGAVIITAGASVDIDATSKILANGTNAVAHCTDGINGNEGGGGGGAGGFIGIYTPLFIANSISSSTTPMSADQLGIVAASTVAHGGASGGADGPVLTSDPVLAALKSSAVLSAKGGDGVGKGAGNGVYGGGGGLIIIAAVAASPQPVNTTPSTPTDNTTGNNPTTAGTGDNPTGNTPVNNPTSGTWAQTGVTNGSTSTTSLAANLVASPATGTAPLTGVQLTATVANITPNTTVNYTFYCDLNTPDITMPNTALLDKILATSNLTQTAGATCNYAVAGTYHPKVVVENGSQPSVYTIIPISVKAGAAAVVAPTTTTPAVTTTRTVAIKNGYFSSGNDDWGISGNPYDSAYAAGSCSKKDPCFRMQRNQLFAANDSSRAIWQDIGALNQGKSYTISLWSKHAIWYNSTGRLKLIDTTANQVVAEIDLSGSYRTWINSSASFTPNDSNYTHNYQVRIESDSGFRRYTGLLVDDIVIQER